MRTSEFNDLGLMMDELKQILNDPVVTNDSSVYGWFMAGLCPCSLCKTYVGGVGFVTTFE